MNQGTDRNLIFLSLSQFGMTFSYNYIMVFMPFFIYRVTPYSPQETLIWVGLIMGSANFVVAFSSIYWGTLTSRVRPKRLYLMGMLSQTVVFLLMGFTSSLQVLLLLRILHGLFGGCSTIGLIIISCTSTRERISADIGLFQTFLTLGHLVGPPLGALAASAWGYQGAFISACALLVVVLLFCHIYVTDVPLQPKGEKLFGRSMVNQHTLIGWMICFTVTAQLLFLPSVLPNVLEGFHVEKTARLEWAGILIMFYTATATLGTFSLTRISGRIGRNRMIIFLVLLGTLFQSFLSLCRGVGEFTVIRMAQTGFIAATIPLVISIFAAESKGSAIGFLNSSRFAGAALGPILATSILAESNLTTLYLVISGLTLLPLFAFAFFFKATPDHVT
jgi:DHA1 family multidrug resistance protein-like MFS transporter